MIPLGEVYMHACHRKRSKISMSAVAATTTDVACAQAAVAVARRALRALKGLVKFQAPFRGFLVRNRVAATLYSMQALLRAQLAVRSKRAELAVRYQLVVQPQIRHGNPIRPSRVLELMYLYPVHLNGRYAISQIISNMAGDTPLPKQPIDKAYSIASIKACIPTPLDLDKVNYNSWSSKTKENTIKKLKAHIKRVSKPSTSECVNGVTLVDSV
ncbi:IQ-DOMAIN 14-like protein [Tanacetum coccineum]